MENGRLSAGIISGPDKDIHFSVLGSTKKQISLLGSNVRIWEYSVSADTTARE